MMSTYSIIVPDNGHIHTASQSADGHAPEAEAMKTTELVLRSLERSMRTDVRTFSDLDVEMVEGTAGRYRVRTALDTSQNAYDYD